MKLCYISGPYRAECALKTSRNVSRAEQMGKRLTLERPEWFPVIPHKNTELWDFDGGLRNVQPEYYLSGTLEVMRRCDAVLVLPDYRRSSGTLAEIAEAERLGIPVYYSVGSIPHGD
ncbi:DUF4406 domain-containing protein [Salmonella enterica subsp. enterica serovar Schwarzengrund]|nr:DUF4406 domain-containing protein [Salmonella enterica subsp. enterica serovar Schwarzengrund]